MSPSMRSSPEGRAPAMPPPGPRGCGRATPAPVASPAGPRRGRTPPMPSYEVTDGKHFRLADHDPRADSGIDGKEAGRAEVARLTAKLEVLHDKLYADGSHKVLIVLQGMDTAGKGGAIRRAFEGLDPTGVHVAAF